MQEDAIFMSSMPLLKHIDGLTRSFVATFESVAARVTVIDHEIP